MLLRPRLLRTLEMPYAHQQPVKRRFASTKTGDYRAPEWKDRFDNTRHERPLAAVRCSTCVEARPMDSVAQEPCAYGQSRGVMPFSCAYFAADASTSGRTNA